MKNDLIKAKNWFIAEGKNNSWVRKCSICQDKIQKFTTEINGVRQCQNCYTTKELKELFPITSKVIEAKEIAVLCPTITKLIKGDK